MKPGDVATRELLAFLSGALPPPPARVLEVGGGRGDPALALTRRNYLVTVVDCDAEAITIARAAGVPAVEADWLAYDAGPQDALLFTRSLHHISKLSEAVARAAQTVRSGGVVVVDEFARERADAATACFFYDLRAVLSAADVLMLPDAELPADPLERWEQEYGGRREHPLHTGAAMVEAIRNRFSVEVMAECPYVYRHFAQSLEESERGAAVARALLAVERRRLAGGEIMALGLRVVARA